MADDLIVPGEFIDDNLGLPLPEAPPPELRTRLNPEGKRTERGADFGISFRGSQRQNTILGAGSETADIATANAPEGSPLRMSERERLEQAARSDSPLEAATALKALDRKESRGTLAKSRAEQAQDSIIEQIAYEHSGAFQSVGGVAGSLLGAVASPENIGGLESILVRRLPMLAQRPILTAGLDAAITNTLTDPVVQGIRLKSGAQENYDLSQTLLAPVIGFGAGAALRGAGVALERATAGRVPAAEPAGAGPAVRESPEARLPDAERAPKVTPEREQSTPSLSPEEAPQPLLSSPDPSVRSIVDNSIPSVEPAVRELLSPEAVPDLPKIEAAVREGATAFDNEIARQNGAVPTEASRSIEAPLEARAEAPATSPDLATEDAGLLFRRRGGQAPGQPLPNQIEMGRPKVDQGTATSPELATKVTRLEDLSRKLVDAFETVGRSGRVAPGAQGQYNTRVGTVRVRQVSDFDTLAHEVGHALHMEGGAKSDFDQIIKSNVRELQSVGAGAGKEGDAEAFANLFHAYVTNRPFAERNYPRATRQLDELLRSKFPKQAEQVEEIRAALDVLHRAPSEALVSADQISKPPPRFGQSFHEAVQRDIDPQGRTVFSVMDALYTATVDKFHPIAKAIQSLADTAKQNGKNLDLKPVEDAYILARLMPGSHGAADTMLKHGVIPSGGIRPEGPSLSSGIEKALGQKFDQDAFNDFGAYLTARRMVAEYDRFFAGELERPPGKFSQADYQNSVKAFEEKHPSFVEGAANVYAFQKNHLTRLFNKGMVTKEFYEAATARNDYVPLMRDMEDFGGEVRSSGGVAGKALAYSVAKKFKGSDRSVINPLESIFKRVHDLEFAIAQNDTVRALAKMSETAGPGSGYIVEPIPNNQMRAQHVDLIEALKSAGKSEGIDEADLTQLILQVEDRFGDSTWATLFRQEPIKEGREPIVFYWENGERRAVRLGDQRLGREMYHALTALSDYEKNWFVSLLQIGQMMLRTGVTRSADFMLANFIRDQFTAALTAGRKYTPFVSAARGVVDLLTHSDEAIQFAGGGGIAGGAVVSSIEHSGFGKNVYALTKGGLLEKIGKAFDASEAGTRIGLYKSYFEQAKQIGLDDENASMWAVFRANDYIDFRRHGSSLGILRRTIPFLNAAVQGSDSELRAAAALPRLETKRLRGDTLTKVETDRLRDARVAWVRLMSLGLVSTGLYYANRDNERFQNAPKFTRDQNFLFTIGGVDFALPKGFGIVQSVVNLFERAAELMDRKDPTIAADWFDAAGSAFAPPTQNPFVSTFMDVTANYNRFREREIVPYYMQGWEKPEQYNAYTSMLARQMAKGASKIGIDLSPMKIDYTLQQLGGGLARDFLFGWDVAMGSEKPEKQIYDYPVLRRFVKNLERGSQANQAFYKLVGEKTGRLEQVENAYRGKINNGERAGAEEYLRNLNDDERAWVVLNTFGFSTAEKRMNPLYNARERVAIMNGMVRQLVNGNVVKEGDLDRTNLTISRRDAVPIAVDAKQRADLIEELLSMSVATTRNAMVSVGAKGTGGLGLMNVGAIEDRLAQYSPEVAEEFRARLAKKNLPPEDLAAEKWPEIKRRLLIDGENADLSDLVSKKRKRRN